MTTWNERSGQLRAPLCLAGAFAALVGCNTTCLGISPRFNHPDGGTDGGGAVGVSVSASSDAGYIWGSVVDLKGAPIVGAQVSAGGASAVTSGSGHYALYGLATGRVMITASAPSFFPARLESNASARGFREELVLAPMGAATAVSAAQPTTVAAGSASIDFPAAAFAIDAGVRAAWLAGSDLAAAPCPLVVADADAHAGVVLGVLEVDLPAEPSQPVSVHVPVPPDAGAAELALYSVDATTGELTDPVAPDSVSSGTATFTVTHFSGKALVWSQGDLAVITYAAPDGGTYTLPSGETHPLVTGARIPLGAKIDTAGQFVCQVGFSFYDGSTKQSVHRYRVCWAKGSVTIDRSPEGIAEAFAQGIPLRVQLVDGRSSPPPHQLPKYLIRTKTAVMGVRGTTATFDFDPCQNNPSAQHDEVEVDEGEVDYDDPNESDAISSGEAATACDGCTAAATCSAAHALADVPAFVPRLRIQGDHLYFLAFDTVLDSTGSKTLASAILRAPIAGGSPTVLVSGGRFLSMTTDSASVYYVEALPDDGAELKSIALDGSASKTLVSGHFFPPTLGTAWPSWVIGADAASVYWTGSDVEMDPVTGLGKYDGIFKSPIEGGAATRLTPALYNNLVYLAPAFFSHPNPGDQDLYAVDRDTVYWAQSQGGGGFVGTLSVNGGDPVNLDSNLSPGPYALIIDDDFVYYVADSLKKMPKGGGTPKSLGGLGYTELALDATHLYSFGGGNTIYRLSKNGGAVETVATGQEMPACIAVDDERVYGVTYPLYPSTNNVTRSVIMTIPK